ncbi:MAG: hypothetical protein KF849_07460 [Rhizobiaceae bacterium]|nr:hypothetical protein [Rhizobiaceae bacterium]
MPRRARRAATWLAALVLVAGGGALALLLYPQPLYAYSASAGRLAVHSDRPFDQDKARLLLAEVERRLATAPTELRDGASTYHVFVANSEWRRRLSFLWNYGAGGVNYYPIAWNAFLRQADIDAGALLRSDGTPVPQPRTLAYYAAHEIGHSLIGRRAGAFANWRLPAWIREGLADYLGFGGEVDIEALTAALRRGDPDLDPAKSGLYARYRLLVAFMLEREGWSVDRLLQSDMPIAEAERMLLAAVRG